MPGLELGGQEGATRAHELRRVPHQAVEARSRCALGLSDPHARTLRRRHRRGAGAGRVRPRPSRIRRHGPRSRSRARARTTTRFAAQEAEDYYFHFPDGNASVARLLVRRLVPDAIPGSTAADLVTTRADYAKLDTAGAPVRIRLSSPVMRVRHTAAPGSTVEVTYSQGGTLKSVTGRSVVLACWHSVIPGICPELPAPQKAALDFAIKVPLVYTNVFIRSWTAFQKLGVQRISTPGLWHASVGLDFPVSVGGYKHQTNPAEPIVLHLSKAVCKPGLPIRDQHRAGRQELLTTTFGTIERSIRDQLGTDAGRRRLRSRGRHSRDHRESLAARLRLSIQLALRGLLAEGRRAAVRGRAAAARTNRDRQFRFAGLRLHRRGHRSRTPRGAGAACLRDRQAASPQRFAGSALRACRFAALRGLQAGAAARPNGSSPCRREAPNLRTCEPRPSHQ